MCPLIISVQSSVRTRQQSYAEACSVLPDARVCGVSWRHACRSLLTAVAQPLADAWLLPSYQRQAYAARRPPLTDGDESVSCSPFS